ncbi:hypothetical protein EVAR_8033_1 [Eumeta japonica]|uniref:Uncharacterized protein n=1 Tax=Eumeta variegata TaxID=151549 RepID=A0A4C1TKB9_EUMVA|nr:hypothetical protein EVAR_8033_1 [Eumeta japonica]
MSEGCAPASQSSAGRHARFTPTPRYLPTSVSVAFIIHISESFMLVESCFTHKVFIVTKFDSRDGVESVACCGRNELFSPLARAAGRRRANAPELRPLVTSISINTSAGESGKSTIVKQMNLAGHTYSYSGGLCVAHRPLPDVTVGYRGPTSRDPTYLWHGDSGCYRGGAPRVTIQQKL